MEEITKRTYIVYRSNAWRVADTILEMVGFVGLLWYNHAYLSGNGWLDALFVIGWFIVIASIGAGRTTRFKSGKDAIKYIEENL